MSTAPPSPWRVALTLRWRIWRRRYVSPLEAVVLAVVAGLAFLVGRAAAEQLERSLIAAAGTLTVAVALGAATSLARRALFRSRELALLLVHGLPPRDLVRLRALELSAALAAATVPLLAAAAGWAQASDAGPTPALALGLLVLPPALAGLALLAGWSLARAGRSARLVGGAALLLALLGGLAAPEAARAVLGHPLAPGGALLDLASGRPGLGLLALAALGGAALLLADRLVPRGFGATLDRALPRRRPGGRAAWRLLGWLSRPLGRQAGALVQRDLALLGRGGFVRGLLILAALPGSLAIVHVVQQDRQLQPWHLVLVGLLVTGVVGAAAGFLFGVDFPRARRGCLVLERTQPLRARAVLLSRWVPAALYAGAVAGGAALIMLGAPRPQLAAQALTFLPGGLLIAAITSHHAVAYGMRGETQLDPAEAAAYPFNGAVVVILFALGLAIHPLAALGYVLWAGFVTSALRRWERAEVETSHGAAA